jgi:hypothetical protein
VNVIAHHIDAGGADQARFDSRWGSFLGVWRGPLPMPWATSVDVELTLLGDYAWADLTFLDKAAGFEIVGDVNHVTALVEQVDQDHIATLRIGDGLVLFDAEGSPPAGIVGMTLRLSGVLIDVYPTDI